MKRLPAPPVTSHNQRHAMRRQIRANPSLRGALTLLVFLREALEDVAPRPGRVIRRDSLVRVSWAYLHLERLLLALLEQQND